MGATVGCANGMHCCVDKKHAKTCRITCCVKDVLRSRQLGLCPTSFCDKQEGKDLR